MIRDATPADVPAIASVHVDSWRTTYRGIVPQAFLDALSPDKREAIWRREISTPRHFVVVAEQAGVAGFANGGPNRGTEPGYDAELYAIYVLAPRQRCGLGRRLLRALAQHLVSGRFGSMILWVLRDNPSRAFYERLGGAPAGSKPIEIGGATLEEVAYGWRDLATLLRAAGLP